MQPPPLRLCQNVSDLLIFSLAQPFTAGGLPTKYLSPICRASSLA